MIFVKEIKCNKNVDKDNLEYFKEIMKDLIDKSEKDDIFLDSKINDKKLKIIDGLYEEMGQVLSEKEIYEKIENITIEEGIKLLLKFYNIEELSLIEIASSYSIYSTFNEKIIKQ